MRADSRPAGMQRGDRRSATCRIRVRAVAHPCAKQTTARDELQQRSAALRWLLLRPRLRACPRQRRRRSHGAARPSTWGRGEPCFRPARVVVPSPPRDPESAGRRHLERLRSDERQGRALVAPAPTPHTLAYPRGPDAPQATARESSSSRSRSLSHRSAARSNSSRASASRPRRTRTSPRTLGSRW